MSRSKRTDKLAAERERWNQTAYKGPIRVDARSNPKIREDRLGWYINNKRSRRYRTENQADAVMRAFVSGFISDESDGTVAGVLASGHFYDQQARDEDGV